MSFKYELFKNGVKVRSISKCWTSLLFVEIMKDIMDIEKMGKDSKLTEINFKISRER
jgi:hypothetical protein